MASYVQESYKEASKVSRKSFQEKMNKLKLGVKETEDKVRSIKKKHWQ